MFTPNLRVSELCANAEIKIRPDAKNIAARMEAWDANGQFRIEISVHPDIKNQRELNYILALMLGHVFLDLQPKMAKGELQRSIFEKRNSPLREVLLSPNSASEADFFASALILPKAMVKKAMGALSSKKDVAAFFNVDLQLLEFRLSKLGLLNGASSDGLKAKPAPMPASESKTETKKAPPQTRVEPKASTEARPEPLQARAEPNGSRSEPKAAAKPDSKSLAGQDLSSLARVNRNTAARSYKKEGENLSEVKAPSPKSGEGQASPGLERLRQLARKIDKSVSD